MIFQIGTLRFDAEADVLDANGVSWGLDVLEGWWDTPNVRSEMLDLPLRDGAHTGNAFRSGRVLSLHGGIVHHDTWVTVEAYRTLVAALDLLREDGQFIAYEENEPKMLIVRRAAPIDVTWVGPAIEWETTLVAADWRKYEVTLRQGILGSYVAATSGLDLTVDPGPDTDLGMEWAVSTADNQGFDFAGVTGASPDFEAVNYGTADVYPYIEFRGPSSASMTSFILTNLTTGVELQIDTTVNAGETLIADMAAAYGIAAGSPITLGGVTRYGDWVSPRTPFYLQPGVNVLRFEVLGGTATDAFARVQWRSGWE